MLQGFSQPRLLETLTITVTAARLPGAP